MFSSYHTVEVTNISKVHYNTSLRTFKRRPFWNMIVGLCREKRVFHEIPQMNLTTIVFSRKHQTGYYDYVLWSRLIQICDNVVSLTPCKCRSHGRLEEFVPSELFLFFLCSTSHQEGLFGASISRSFHGQNEELLWRPFRLTNCCCCLFHSSLLTYLLDRTWNARIHLHYQRRTVK